MTLNQINLLIGIIGCSIIVSLLINAVLIWYFIGRRFDKVFPNYVYDKHSLESGWWFLSPFFRACRYGGCLIFKNATVKQTYFRYYFNGYDFRANAKKIDFIVVWVHVIGAALILILGAVLYIINGFHLPPT